VFDCLSDRESEQTGHSFVEKFPEYFSDMPNPKDCNNGRIGEPCDDRFPCGSNTGGTLALYALEDNQYWAENSAYDEGDTTWHTTLAAQTLEAPKRCKVHMLTSKSDASHLAYCKYTSKHQASGFEFCTVTVCTRDESVAHQVGTGLTTAKSVSTVFLTPQEEPQVGQLYVAHANQEQLLGLLEVFRLMVDVTIKKKIICQYDYTSPSCDLVAGNCPQTCRNEKVCTPTAISCDEIDGGNWNDLRGMDCCNYDKPSSPGNSPYPAGNEHKTKAWNIMEAARRTCRSVTFDSSGALAGYQSGRALTGRDYMADYKMYTDPGGSQYQFFILPDFEGMVAFAVDRECSHR